MLLAGNKTKHISTVNYAIKTIHHHHHHHHHHHCLFKVIDNFEWFWMQDLQGFSSLEFDWSSLEFKIQFLVLHIFYYTLMTFLMMLYVILLSMLLILLSTLSVIGHLICGNNQNWFLNLNLIYDTLWTGVGSGLLIPILEKLSWFCLTGLLTMVLLM